MCRAWSPIALGKHNKTNDDEDGWKYNNDNNYYALFHETTGSQPATWNVDKMIMNLK
jgi:hypothetical protein